jgi:drug/metabolite transporter (DMT)-like permease
MPPELLRSGFRFGVSILLLALGSLVFLRPTTPEFWASVAAAIVVGVFIGGLMILLAITHQSPPGKE